MNENSYGLESRYQGVNKVKEFENCIEFGEKKLYGVKSPIEGRHIPQITPKTPLSPKRLEIT